MAIEKMLWPFGAADQATPDYAPTIEVNIENNLTLLAPGTLGGDLTVNLILDAELRPGAMVLYKQRFNTGAETVSFGSGMIAPDMTGDANKTNTQVFIFDGTNFVPAGPDLTID